MATQTVTRRDKFVFYDIAYTANGVASWSFVADGDGEIFGVESNNVDSYTIDGNPVTLPFPLVNGQSYSVGIVKTVPGTVADISLQSRRIADKTINLNAPDFGAFDGRYLYALLSNNTVEKYDTQLFSSSNYIGAGSWTVTPLVSTITLPVTPDGSDFSALTFVKAGGTGKILASARIGTTGTTDSYHCYILSDDSVYDLTETTLNGLTNLTTYSLHTGIKYVLYDYVKEQIYPVCTGSTTRLIGYKLSDLSTVIDSGSFVTLVDKSRINRNYFNPIRNMFSGFGYFDIDSERTYSINTNSNSTFTSGWAYDATRDNIIGGWNIYQYPNNAFDYFGNIAATYNMPFLANAIGQRMCSSSTDTIFVTSRAANSYGYYRISDGVTQSITETTLPAGQTSFKDAFYSDNTSLFFTVGTGGSGDLRLYIYDIDYVTPSVAMRYIDRANNIVQIHSDQLLR